MPETTIKIALEDNIARRTEVLFEGQKNAVYARTDAMFGILLMVQWLAGIIVALLVSPRAWSGSQSTVHLHVWSAVIMGGLIVALPVYLALRRPGETITRHSIGIGQMLFSALLIHLTEGRIETHFHVFGSLAFLSFYRDWRVLLSASLVVALDHILRGYFFPLSVYGVTGIEPWRWIEHAWWVVFEDLFLIRSCLQNQKEMRAIASRQAELEETRDKIEDLVDVRTCELQASERRLATQFAVTSNLAGASSLADAFPKITAAIVKGILEANGTVAANIFAVDNRTGRVQCVRQMLFAPDKNQAPYIVAETNEAKLPVLGLIGQAKISGSLLQVEKLKAEMIAIDSDTGRRAKLTSAFALPLMAEGQMLGAIEFFAEKAIIMESQEIAMLESLGSQLGDFISKMQIQSENLRLANLVEWSGEAIIGLTSEGLITSWNRGAKTYFGYEAEQIKGQNIAMLCPPDRLAEMEAHAAISRQGRTVEGYETRFLTRDGGHIDVSLTHSPIFDDHRRVVGSSAVMHDITARKEADRRVSEFYSIVSHELRTPLTSVRGVLGLIEGGIVEAGSEEAADLMKVARESTDRLIRLINDMLDLKKIESGKMELHYRPVRLIDMVQNTIDSLKGMSETSSVKLKCEINCSGVVFADQDKATQVLTNLLSNAIKFSPPLSEVVVSVEEVETGTVRFKVTDNGPGIAPADQEKLFEKFQQLDSSDARKQGGTGLGLAISKAIVNQHGGQIGLVSSVGQGSSFWFDLPRVEIAAVSAPAMPASRLVGRLADQTSESLPVLCKPESHCILLVEDDSDLAHVLTTHFKHRGYSTVTAGSLSQAREYLGSIEFSVVVLDLNLPDGNGLDLLKEIQAIEKTASLPVIVITGQSIEAKDLAANPKVSDWFAKPFQSGDLIEVIDRLTVEQEVHAVVLTNRNDKALQDLVMKLKTIGVQYVERASLEHTPDSKNTRPDLVILDLGHPDQKAVAELKLLKYKEILETGNQSPLVLYSQRELTKNFDDDDDDPGESDRPPLDENIDLKSDLINTVSALLNGICK